MKHVVVESKPDPVTGVVYHVTPSGPYFDSLYSLVEEARRTKVIQNHLFDVLLTKCPPKVKFVPHASEKIIFITIIFFFCSPTKPGYITEYIRCHRLNKLCETSKEMGLSLCTERPPPLPLTLLFTGKILLSNQCVHY